MIAQGLLGRLGRRVPARRGVRAPTARRRGRALPRRWPRLLVVAVVLAAVLGGLWLWLRDSSLVAVRRVVVSGVRGPDAAQIRAALTTAARNMTTLDVREDALRTAVAPYPVVKSLQVSTAFPHGLRVRVIEQIPVGVIAIAGRPVAVAGDGTLLRDLRAPAQLPLVAVGGVPGGPRVSDGTQMSAVALLGAAPYELLAQITQVTMTSTHGLVAQFRSGPSIYFGDAQRLRAKWTAASAVLADHGSAGAQYIDVTDPERPAAGVTGGANASSSATASGAATSAGTASTTTTPPGG